MKLKICQTTLGIIAILIFLITMSAEGREKSLPGSGTSATGSTDTVTTRVISIENKTNRVIKTLKAKDIIKFKDLSLEVTKIAENDPANWNDDSVGLFLTGKRRSLYENVKEYSGFSFGNYVIYALSVSPAEKPEEASAKILIWYRKPVISYKKEPEPRTSLPKRARRYSVPAESRYRSERGRPVPRPVLVRTLRVGQELRFHDIYLRLRRVNQNDAQNKTDDSAEFVVRTAYTSLNVTILRYRSEFISGKYGIFEIYAKDIRPSERGQGRVRVEITYRRR